MNNHICHVLNHLNMGGAEKYVVQLANHLAHTGHKVSIIAGDPQHLRDQCNHNVHIEILNLHPASAPSIWSYLNGLMGSIRYLIKFFQNNDVNVVHTHLAASALPAWIAAKYCGIPVLHSRMYAGNIGSRYERILFASPFPRMLVHKFLVFTRYSAREVQRDWRISPDNILISSIGVETSHFDVVQNQEKSIRSNFDLTPKDRVILVVARLHPEKDVELAIRTVALLDDPNTVLIIAGEGEQQEYLQNLWGNLTSRSTVKFLGLLSDPRAAYAVSDILLQTSRSPNLGTVVLEAFSSSLPVIIAYRDDDERKMAEDTFGELGTKWMAPADPKKLASLLSEFFDVSEDHAVLGAKVRAFVQRRHSKHSVYGEMIEVYKSMRADRS